MFRKISAGHMGILWIVIREANALYRMMRVSVLKLKRTQWFFYYYFFFTLRDVLLSLSLLELSSWGSDSPIHIYTCVCVCATQQPTHTQITLIANIIMPLNRIESHYALNRCRPSSLPFFTVYNAAALVREQIESPYFIYFLFYLPPPFRQYLLLCSLAFDNER